MALTFNGQTIEFDEFGHLVNAGDWSEELGAHLAELDGQELTPEHWQVIKAMRQYSAEYDMTPTATVFKKFLVKTLGSSKYTLPYLSKLFPYGPSTQVARYGGLPKNPVE